MTRGKIQNFILKKLIVIFTSRSKNFLQGLKNVLKMTLELKYNKVYNSYRSFQLRFSTTNSIKLFKFLYENIPRSLFKKIKK